VAKANLVLVDGTTVAIEGTAEEVALLLQKVSSPSAAAAKGKKARRKSGAASTTKTAARARRKGPQQLMADLAEEGWFKTKRTIGDVQKKLEEKGHIYAMESLSTPLLRLTRNRTLRRIKDKDIWVYVS
jgi:hypothetical protein